MEDYELSTFSDLLSGGSGDSSKKGTRKPRDKALSKENKCLNEKRRREQENIYMEELAELLSGSITDLNSFSNKPDKCAILEETLNHIRRIRSNEGEHSDAVQQSQVSSSKPQILAPDVLGPLLLEALDGFLFVVNSQGKVVFASDNINQLLKYVPDDLIGKSIYNIIHVCDHAQFSSSLLAMTYAWSTDAPTNKSRTFNCRMFINSADEGNSGDEATQNAQYENMQITAVLQPCEISLADTQTCLVCIARRINQTDRSNPHMLGVEQFTTKQDLSGKILACDTGGVNTQDLAYTKYVGEDINNFCHINDLQQLQKHHDEVIAKGSNTSGVYRFKLFDSRYVFVQTKSKLFNNPSTGEPEFIMSTHSIVRECDTDSELKGSASTSLMKSIIGQHKNGDLQKQLGGLKLLSVLGGGSSAQSTSMMGLSNQALLGMHSGNMVDSLAQLLNAPDTGLGGGGFNTQDPLTDINLNDLFDLLPPSADLPSSALSYNNALAALTGGAKGMSGLSQASGAMGVTSTGPPTSWMGSVSSASNSLSSLSSQLNNTIPPNRNAMMVGRQMSPVASTGMPPRGGVSGGPPRMAMPSPQAPHSVGYGPSPMTSPGYGMGSGQRSPGFSPGAHPQRSPGPFHHQMGRMHGSRPPTPSSATGGFSGVPIPSPVPSPLQALESMNPSVHEQSHDSKLLEQIKQMHHNKTRSRHVSAGAVTSMAGPPSAAKLEQFQLKQLLISSDNNQGSPATGSLDALQYSHLQHLQSLGLSSKMLRSKSASMDPPCSSATPPVSSSHTQISPATSSGSGGGKTVASSSSSCAPLPTPPSMHLRSPSSVPPLASPALSSPQQPQSTLLLDDHSPHLAPDSSGRGEGVGGGEAERGKRESNKILKQLLDADEEEDDDTKSEHASSTVPEKGNDESKTNEAEAKTSNKLLIKLLEDDQGGDKQSSNNKSTELLQRLLLEEADSNMNADMKQDSGRFGLGGIKCEPSVSGSGVSRARSGSAADSLTTSTPPSSTQGSRTPNSMLTVSYPNSMTATQYGSMLRRATDPTSESNLRMLVEGAPSPSNKDELQALLKMWERDELGGGGGEGGARSGRVTPGAEAKRKGLKRKLSDLSDGSVHSSNSMMDTLLSLASSPSPAGSGPRRSSTSAAPRRPSATPSEKNVLLAQLLSKNPSNSSSSSSNSDTPLQQTPSVDVCAVPQNKLPKYDKDMWDKINQMRQHSRDHGSVGSEGSSMDRTLESPGGPPPPFSRANSDTYVTNRTLADQQQQHQHFAQQQQQRAAMRGPASWDGPRGNVFFPANSPAGSSPRSQLNQTPTPGLYSQSSLPNMGLSGLLDLPSPSGSTGRNGAGMQVSMNSALAVSSSSHATQPGGGGGVATRPQSRSSSVGGGGPLTPGGGGGGRASSSDPMLLQILQQVSDMRNDIGQSRSRAGGTSTPTSSADMTQTASGTSFSDDATFLSQLESVLSDSQLGDLDTLFNSQGLGEPDQSSSSALSEQMRIELIQKELMNDVPMIESLADQLLRESVSSADSQGSSSMPSLSARSSLPLAVSSHHNLLMSNSGMSPHMPGGGCVEASAHQPDEANAQFASRSCSRGSVASAQYTMAAARAAGAHGPPPPPHMTAEAMALLEQHHHHQRMQHAAAREAASPPRYHGVGADMPGLTPNFPGDPSHIRAQVRRTLLLQSQQKTLREQMLLRSQQQQQQQQQGGPAPPPPQSARPGFPPPNLRMPAPGVNFPQMPSPGIPENFTEMMKTALAPNVSIQRNQQLPGPMGGQFQGGQHGPMGMMMRGQTRPPHQGPSPPPQQVGHARPPPYGPPGAPHTSPGAGSAPGPVGAHQQWTQRANPAMMNGGSVTQYGNMRPRQMSPTGPMGERFGPPPRGPMFHQQGATMLSPDQFRRIQAQRAAMAQQQGLTLPVNPPLSPFPGSTASGGSADPMLLSPNSTHSTGGAPSMSPVSQISPQQQQQQMKPGYSSASSGGISPNFGPQGGPPGPPGAMPMQHGYGGMAGPGGFSPEGRHGPHTPQIVGQQEMYGPGSLQKSPGSGGSGAGGAQTATSDFVKKQVRGFLTNKTQQAAAALASQQSGSEGPQQQQQQHKQQQQQMGGGGPGPPPHQQQQMGAHMTPPHPSHMGYGMPPQMHPGMGQHPAVSNSLAMSMPPHSMAPYSSHLQHSVAMSSHSPQLSSASSVGGGSRTPQSSLSSLMDSQEGELPMNVLEALNELTGGDSGLLDDALPETKIRYEREQARGRYEQFKQLSFQGQPDSSPLGAEKKAHNLFRSQLLSRGSSSPARSLSDSMDAAGSAGLKPPDTPTSVSVLQTELRAPVDDIRPQAQNNSLLQQLLSENS